MGAIPAERSTTAEAGLLTMDAVDFSYDGRHTILDHVSLALHAGERLLILGDNGSGKSTLGHLLSGFLTPTMGRISIAGASPSLTRVRDRVRLVSYMGQVSHLQILTSSIESELAEFAPPGSAPASAIYQEWRTRCELPEDIGINPRDLPATQLWRLLLLMYGLVLRPRLLIVDELLAATDRRQHNCTDAIMSARSELGLATILLYQRQLPLAIDRLATLRDGRLREVVAQSRHPG